MQTNDVSLREECNTNNRDISKSRMKYLCKFIDQCLLVVKDLRWYLEVLVHLTDNPSHCETAGYESLLLLCDLVEMGENISYDDVRQRSVMKRRVPRYLWNTVYAGVHSYNNHEEALQYIKDNVDGFKDNEEIVI